MTKQITPRSFFVLRAGFSALCALAVIVGLALPVSVQATDGSTPASVKESSQSVNTDTARQLVYDLGTEAIALLGDKSIPIATRDAKFHALFDRAFDLRTIGRYVIGQAWLSATPAQRDEYTRLFDALVVQIYSDRLSLYSGEGFRIVAVRPENDRDVLVTTDIIHPDGRAPTRVDWRVRRFEKRLAIIDVVVEGVSMSVSQRQEYTSVIQRNGGNIDSLLSLMRQRLEKPTSNSKVAVMTTKQRQG